MATDLKDYTRMIDSSVDEALDSVADTILTKMGIKEEDDPKYVKYYEVYEDIEKYLIQKWEKEIRDRFIRKQVKKAEEDVRRYVESEYNRENGTISFHTDDEAKKAEEVFHEMGYETERSYDEGCEQVNYWKPGHRPDQGI